MSTCVFRAVDLLLVTTSESATFPSCSCWCMFVIHQLLQSFTCTQVKSVQFPQQGNTRPRLLRVRSICSTGDTVWAGVETPIWYKFRQLNCIRYMSFPPNKTYYPKIEPDKTRDSAGTYCKRYINNDGVCFISDGVFYYNNARSGLSSTNCIIQ